MNYGRLEGHPELKAAEVCMLFSIVFAVSVASAAYVGFVGR